jgi:N-acetylglucosamine malate deacetylase 1
MLVCRNIISLGDMMKRRKLLFVSPHTDDAEIACGGMIARMVENKYDVYYIALSACERSVPEGYPTDILRMEVKKATKVLGIKPKNLRVYDFEVREFPIQRQEILDTLFKLEKSLKPEMVVCPSSHDLHQDHITTRNEVLRTFRKSTILGFEMPWDNISFNVQAFVPLEERHVKKKLRALECYESQKHRVYLTEDYIRGLAHTRGMQISTEYAEAFEVIRWIINGF